MQFPRYSEKQLTTERETGLPAPPVSTESFQQKNNRDGSASGLLLAGLAIVFFAGLIFLGKSSNQTSSNQTTKSAGPSEHKEKSRTEPRSPGYAVTIRKPDGPPRVFTGINDSHGQPVTVACSTCHATREPNFGNRSVTDLNEFHGSLEFAHGTVSCLSCHNSTDYDALKLADGTRVEFTEVMTLCAQCHGSQMRDYEHGAHGGFNGYWDLSRGPRIKNNCVDCHNPHAPRFPGMQPTFKPKDRFLDKVPH